MNTTPSSSTSSPPSRSVTLFLHAALVLGLTGALVQLVLKDRWAIIAPLFYTLPLPLIASLWATVGVFWWRRRRRGLGAFQLLLGAAAVALLFQTSWCSRPRASHAAPSSPRNSARTPVRVVTWNLLHGRLGAERVAQGVRDLEPDVAALQECSGFTESAEVWARTLPGYTVVPFGRELLVLCAGSVRSPRLVKLGPGARLATCEVRVQGRRFLLAVVDFASGPLRSRRPIFERLVEELDRFAGALPRVLLGDFNTSRGSVCFEELRGSWTNAFVRGGHGFGHTWPSFLPLWDLDQVWIGPRWRVISCTTPATLRSDHRPVVAVLE